MALEDELARLRKLKGIKWTRFDSDVLPAWVADMDLPPAPMAVEAVRSLADRGDFGYNSAGREQLADAFATWQRESHGWDLDPSKVRTFCNVLQGIDATIWHNTEPGDGVVLFTPIYPPFIKAVEKSGRRIVDCPLDRDGWRINAETLESVIDDRTRVILLCNPHNPTGRAFTAAELESVADVARRHDLIVIADEVWADLVHPGNQHVPFAPLLPGGCVVLSSASKSFNLAGLRTAVAFIDHDGVVASLDAIPSHLLGATSSAGCDATLACWVSGREWLDQTKSHLVSQRDHLAARLAAEAPDVGFSLPDATYLAWIDLNPVGLGPNPAIRLLNEAKVAFSYGPDFGHRGEGFVRINLATSREILDAVLDRFLTAVQAWSDKAVSP